MNILVINGDCIFTNTSANLCHQAYIRGLVEAGHRVEVLCADGRDYKTDPSMVLPPEVKVHTFYGVSLYEKASLKKNSATSTVATSGEPTTQTLSLKRKLICRAKGFILSLYGPHGIYAPFVRKARKFHSDKHFDCVLSLSTPPSSHLLAHKLIRSGHIKTDRWIQIWEDPWYTDAYGFNSRRRIFREERRLLSFGERICYVSPLTLKNQQRLYPESADKMFWQPLPYYYKNEAAPAHTGPNVYGYFGDYAPVARNLEPFYQAAKKTGIRVEICGNPCNLFPTTDSIHIHPRLPLHELKPIENSANVLIFLCNRQGGQIPGKIYQYSATEKTILFILDGTEEEQQVLREFFGRFNRYVFCRNTGDDIARAIAAIEAGELGAVKNRPLEDFAPQKTIHNILNG